MPASQQTFQEAHKECSYLKALGTWYSISRSTITPTLNPTESLESSISIYTFFDHEYLNLDHSLSFQNSRFPNPLSPSLLSSFQDSKTVRHKSTKSI